MNHEMRSPPQSILKIPQRGIDYPRPQPPAEATQALFWHQPANITPAISGCGYRTAPRRRMSFRLYLNNHPNHHKNTLTWVVDTLITVSAMSGFTLFGTVAPERAA
jgi:hypothetical protein